MYRQRIIVATEQTGGLKSGICSAFGKAPYYLIVTVESGRIVETKADANHRFSGHQLGLLNTVCRCGASVLLAGGMEPRVRAMFTDIGVEVVCDLQGSAEAALEDYLTSEHGIPDLRENDTEGYALNA